MDIEQVIAELNQRFSMPLQEFYSRRIIFWYDEDKDFEDKLDQVRINNVELLVLTGSNNFEAKKLLTRDKPDTNFLVYCPIMVPTPDDDWLLDVKLYSESFRADLISIWMKELGLSNYSSLRPKVKKYRKFFNAKDRRAKFKRFATPTTPDTLILTIMAAVTGAKTAQPSEIIQAVIDGGLDLEQNTAYQALIKYQLEPDFILMVASRTGYQELDFSLEHLVAHILFSAASKFMSERYLEGLDYSISNNSFCYDFVFEWLREDDESLYQAARGVEDRYQLVNRFLKVPLTNLLETTVFPCVNEIIIEKIVDDISLDLADPDKLEKLVELRQTSAWYDQVSSYFDCVNQTAKMLRFKAQHSAGFHTTEPKVIWKEYTEDYYHMDTYYRHYHDSYQACLRNPNMKLDDKIKQLTAKVEGIYINWFLKELSDNWSKMSEDELENYGHILKVEQQRSFYQNYVEASTNRVFVVISDAMRYEVAAELVEQLQQETRSQVAIHGVQGIFPTVTKFGMAALLPNKEIYPERTAGGLRVMVDGQSSDASNREMILKAANPDSCVLKYDDIRDLTRDKRSSLVKGMKVVYIYHNQIDKRSHHDKSAMPAAVDDTLTDLKNITKMIINEFSGTNIYFTSDHGFLYTYSNPNEHTKISHDLDNSYTLEIGNRYAIQAKTGEIDSSFLKPVSMSYTCRDVQGYTAPETIRIKKSGSGMNFVHGGTSLQEMVVPVVEFHHVRSDTKEYLRNQEKYDTKPVELGLLDTSRELRNKIFNMNFYQKDAVSANRTAVTYSIYFEDVNKELVSDVQQIIADKSNEDIKERQFRLLFSLKDQAYDSLKPYYLVIKDESGLQAPVRIEFRINIPMSIDGFDF